MKSNVFALLTLIGLTLRMLIIIGLGAWLRAPIESVLAWIERTRLPGTILLVLGTAIYHWRRRAAARGR